MATRAQVPAVHRLYITILPCPHSVTMEQAAHFAESLAKGEPNRKKIALTVMEDKVREMV